MLGTLHFIRHLLTLPMTSATAERSFSTMKRTRHRASASMYSLTFCVRVTTPPRYGQNGTAHAASASMLSPVRGVFAGMRSVRVRHACGGPGGLPLGSAFPLCCHSDATRAPIANPPNSAQLGDSPYHSPKLHPGPCNSVGMRPRTDRQTDRQTRVTTIHFSWSIRLTRNVIMIRRQACLVTTYTHR